MKALITGASSGIGQDMARYLAKQNIDLILVARRKDRLEELKKELKVNVKIIPLDLSQKENCYKLYEEVKDEDITILINNAGFGLFGDFWETDLNEELKMIDTNIIAPHILTKLFLQDFLKKNEGYILNVASSAGFMAGPHLSTYYATKNYLAKLTMAINEEIKKKKANVSISCLCPGPVNTEFTKVAKGTSSQYVAKYGIDKMFQKKMIIVPTLKMKLALFGIRFIPQRLALNIVYHLEHAKTKDN